MLALAEQITAPGDLDAMFAALADPTRRAILVRLTEGEASVMDLAEPFTMSQPAISKHLKVLERAGLISRHREGQRRPCRVRPERLDQLSQWLESYRKLCEANFQQLDVLLAELQAPHDRDPSEQADANRRPGGDPTAVDELT